MAHYAQVVDGIVVNVTVGEPSYMDNYEHYDPCVWVQTSYNTVNGVHSDGGTPLRKNYAAVGYTYDRDRDAFYPPQPYASWTLNETTCRWEAPVEVPTDDACYTWNETDQAWETTE